jgi:hypothetical protein
VKGRKIYDSKESTFWSPQKEGDNVSGVYIGISDSLFGKIIILQTVDGCINVAVTRTLERALGLFEEGKAYKIVYTGRIKSRRGRGYKNYEIYEI